MRRNGSTFDNGAAMSSAESTISTSCTTNLWSPASTTVSARYEATDDHSHKLIQTLLTTLSHRDQKIADRDATIKNLEVDVIHLELSNIQAALESSVQLMEAVKIMQRTSAAEYQRLNAEVQDLRDRAVLDEAGKNFAEMTGDQHGAGVGEQLR